jgi:hypothetical protein
MSRDDSFVEQITRRTFLASTGVGVGAAALSLLLHRDLFAAGTAPRESGPYRGLPGFPHHAPRIKRVIFLYMSGGPSHLETFDYKPELQRQHGNPMPESFTRGQPIAQLQGQELKIQEPMTKFKQCGKSGQWISDFLPYHARLADDICVIRSMVTEQINHDPAHTFLNTGTALSGRPSMGAWVTYGLGSECEDLPGFVVLTSFAGRSPQPISTRMWGPGFLPSRFQGVAFNSSGDPVHYLRPPKGAESRQADLIDVVGQLDRHRNVILKDPEIASRIAAYETAFRMQVSVPELMDVSREPQKILDMYGAKPGDGSFASNCLLARRLAERGVRFIQLFHRDWDHHGDLVKYMKICADATDRPAWALLTDLKQRGMLDETLVVWGGEFGRTPMFQGKGGPGRDHHIKGFSMWLAGGGVKGGCSHGATDELGYHATENIVHVRDLHATMLHLFGIDHTRFGYKYQGLESRLTGVEKAHVLKEILA